MQVYLFIISITFIFAILSINRNTKKITVLWCSVFLFIILSLFAGTRLFGFDYDNYKDHFEECPYIYNYYRYITTMELGYELFVSFCKSISTSFHFFLLFFTCLSIGITLKLCYKYSPYPLVSFLMFFAYSFFTQVMGQMRQPIAISITYLLLLPLILKKKYLSSIILIVTTAFLLHKSLFFLLFGLIVNNKILSKRIIKIIICITIGCYTSSTILIKILPQIVPQNFYLYEVAIIYLTDKSNALLFSMGMIERIVMCLIIWFYVRKYQLYNQSLLRLFVNFYFIGTCLYFATIALSADFASRGTQVLGYSLFFILPIIYKNVKLKDKKRLLIIIVLWSLYLSMTFMRSQNIFLPYKSVIF